MEHNHNMPMLVPIVGMHCASCAINIETVLKEQPGVKSIEVNYGNEKAKIDFDSKVTSLDVLNESIKPLGYSFAKEFLKKDESKTEVGQNNKLKELEREKKKVLLSLPIALITFAFMIRQMLAMNIESIPTLGIPEETINVVLLIIATIILFGVGNEFLKEIWVFIKYRVANMYTLVGIGTLVAYVYSAFIVLFPNLRESLGLSMNTYFDVTIIVIAFVYFGKYLETKSKYSTGEAITKLLNLQAKTALVKRDGKEMELPIDDILVGDLVIVKPGSKIALDGVIVEGKSYVDESMLIGEPLPLLRTINDRVIGGTTNKNGYFVFRTTKVGKDTVLSQIIKMVDEAQGSKAPIQGLADKISAIFVPTVLIISLITLMAWLIIGSMYMPFNQALSYGLICFTGVLVIACPCALGLATPTAIIVGSGKGAENGILIKDAESLEKLSMVDTIVTDKTGTLTKGKPEVNEILTYNDFKQEDVIQLAGSIEKLSQHPLAEAVVNKAKEMNIELLKVSDFENFDGKGIKGTIDGNTYYIGNTQFAEELGVEKINKQKLDEMNMVGKTTVLVIKENILISVLVISDGIKDGVKETIKELHNLGIQVIMLTGDNVKTAEYIAKELGIKNVFAQVLPKDKASKIKELQDKGEIVAMIGDGINDSPALAQSNIGIAMSTGSDIAIESASITLLKGDFSKVLMAIKLSKFTIKAIKQNLFWAFSYNTLGIPIAAGLLYPFFGIVLNPAIAGLAMALSSISVITNSLRLKRAKLK